MAFNGSKKPKRPTRGGVIAALDVGSTKVCCLVARVDETGVPNVVGVGHQVSNGVRAGVVVDMEATTDAVGAAVQAAEEAAGETVRDVLVSVAGGHQESRTVGVEVGVSGEIGESDVQRALAQVRAAQTPESRVIHAIPIGYTLDDSRGIRDPRGMFGERLGVQVHLVTAGANAVRNLGTSVARCHLDVEALVASPFAAGLACLVEDERDLGVTLIDMGGGTTTIGVFIEGKLVHTDCIPVGGAHVTNDIARGLTTTIAHAERMKTLHGSAMASVSDERETIEVPQVGEEGPGQASQVPKSLLVGIIQPRIEEIFELVRSRLEASGFGKVAGRRVVLTGGACQLPGTRELAQLILDKQVRMGRPTRVVGLDETTGGPAFAAAAGLLIYALEHQSETPAFTARAQAPGGLWGRMGLWLKEYL